MPSPYLINLGSGHSCNLFFDGIQGGVCLFIDLRDFLWRLSLQKGLYRVGLFEMALE